MNFLEIQIKILFVCLGNICRSPAAQGIMLHLLSTEYKYLENKIFVDSCGTTDYNDGDLPDRRMREQAEKRGIILNHRARGINEDDLKKFDLIIAMDYSNYADLISMGGDKNKIKQMIDFVENKKGYNEIPDPYYGGIKGFNDVLDLIEDGCKGLIQYIINEFKL